MVRERESIDAKGLCRYRDGVTEDSPHIALFWDVLQVREREGGGGDHGEPRLHARTHMQRQIPLGCGTFAPFYLAHRARAHTQAAPSPTPAPPPSHAHTHTHAHERTPPYLQKRPPGRRLLLRPRSAVESIVSWNPIVSLYPGRIHCICAHVRLSNPGYPRSAAESVVSLRYNKFESVRQRSAVEPIASNNGYQIMAVESIIRPRSAVESMVTL